MSNYTGCPHLNVALHINTMSMGKLIVLVQTITFNIFVTFSVEWLILDEADKLFEEGKDGFREQVSLFYLSM